MRSVCSFAAIFLLLSVPLLAQDSDSDGMPDAYENFFGLNVSNAADAAYNSDDDTLTNITESVKWTDPFYGDSDRDGFKDGFDNNPTSRVFIAWGDDFFTDTNPATGGASAVYDYAGPVWWLQASSVGGGFVTNNPSSWHVPATQAADTGSVAVDVDRTRLTNNVVLLLDFYDYTNASLYVDLYNSNGTVIVTNLAGNLTRDSALRVTTNLNVPLASHSTATGIRIRRGTGQVRLYETRLYIDQDGDGLDKEQEAQVGSSDSNPDTDNDGLSDYAEVFTYHTSPINGDTDGDLLSDGAEVLTYGTDPLLWDTDGDGLDDRWEIENGLNAQGLPKDHVAGWWRLDEESGPLLDSSTNGNTGTVTGATRVAGLLGNALSFDGQNDLALVTNASAYKPANLTLAVRLKMDSLYGNAVSNGVADGTMVVVAQKNAGSGLAYGLYKTAGHALAFEAANGASTGRVTSADGLAVPGTWLDLAGTYDGSNLLLHVNGVRVGQTVWTHGLNYATNQGLTLGHGPVANDGWAQATLDDVLVLNRALTTSEASALSQAGQDPDQDGLSTREEYEAGTDPTLRDMDGDGLTDGEELALGTDPENADSDGDWLLDSEEVYYYHTNPLLADSDFDGLQDDWELVYGNPTSAPAAILGYWKLDETNGTTAADASVYRNHGTYTGTASVTGMAGVVCQLGGYGAIGTARRFDGVDDAVSMANAAAYKPTGAFTLLAYAKFDSLYGNAVTGMADGTMTLMAQPGSAGRNAYALYKTASNALVFEISDATSSVSISSADGFLACHAVTPSEGGYRVAGVYDGASVTLIANEVIVATAATAIQPVYDATNGLRLGAPAADRPGGHFAGTLDDVRVFGEALDLTDLATVQAAFTYAFADGDGDSLLNIMESLAGTSPTLADTDGNGVNDNLDHDADRDGLGIAQEISLGTDPWVADSDGDGVNDGEEVLRALTNPLVADFDGNVTVVSRKNGSSYLTAKGDWVPQFDEVQVESERGYIEYELSASTSDLYRVVVVVPRVEPIPSSAPATFDLKLTFDGLPASRQKITVEVGKEREVVFYSPWTTAGVHRVGVEWEHLSPYSLLRIREVRLESLGGADANQNLTKDWVETRFAATSWVNCPTSSMISPLCIEGSDPFAELTHIGTVMVSRAIGTTWYADCPLDDAGTTVMLVAFQNSGKLVTNCVQWVPFNVPSGSDMLLRQGDAMLFTAGATNQATGTVTIAVWKNGTEITNSTVAWSNTVPFTFGSTGAYTVIGSSSIGGAGTVLVTACAASFASNPACMRTAQRTWDATGLVSQAVVVSDSRVAITNAGTPPAGGVRYLLTSQTDEPTWMIARLGTNGPVMARIRCDNFRADNAEELTVVEEYGDGSQLVEGYLIMPNAPPDVRVEMHVFVSGVTFDDYTIDRTVYMDSFDDISVYRYRLIRGAGIGTSACHTTKVYQHSELISGN